MTPFLFTLAQATGEAAQVAQHEENVFNHIVKTFGVSVPHLLAQFIVFIIIAAILQKYAYGPVIAILDERKKRIEEGLANAEKSKTELANAETLRRQILAKANAQAEQIVADANKRAVVEGEKRTQEAIQQAEQIVQKAHQASRLEHERTMAHLRGEVARLVVDVTSKVSGKVLTSDDQKRLNEETAQQLSARN